MRGKKKRRGAEGKRRILGVAGRLAKAPRPRWPKQRWPRTRTWAKPPGFCSSRSQSQRPSHLRLAVLAKEPWQAPPPRTLDTEEVAILHGSVCLRTEHFRAPLRKRRRLPARRRGVWRRASGRHGVRLS